MNLLASGENAHSFLGSKLTHRVKILFCTREKFSRGVPGASPWFSDLRFNSWDALATVWICPVNLCLLLRKIREMLLLGLFKWILSGKIIRGLQNNYKINILYVNYGAECLKVYLYVLSIFFSAKSAQYTVFTMEIRKQRENSKLISNPLKNSIKFSVVYLRVTVTHFVPTGTFKLPPSSRPQISKGNL